jgi:uncharacterized protein HemY
LLQASNLLQVAETGATGAVAQAWLQLTRGIFEYRGGNYGSALPFFEAAAKTTNVYCQASALVFQAMAAKHLGQAKEADQLWRQAQGLLPGLQALPESPGKFPNLQVVLFAVEEAESLMRSSDR